MYRKWIKRFLDFVFSLIALVVLSPIFLILSVLVYINLGTPVFFKQRRPGKDEKVFTLYKFRTMTNAKDSKGEILPDSKRLTRLGRFLRSSSIDELPELWNILRGNMSFIGPRPLLVEYLPYYTETERIRHEIRPGLTGYAQVNGRNKTKWDTRLAQDVYYVKNYNFRMDVKIFFQTIFKVFKRDDILQGEDLEKRHIKLDKLRETK